MIADRRPKHFAISTIAYDLGKDMAVSDSSYMLVVTPSTTRLQLEWIRERTNICRFHKVPKKPNACEVCLSHSGGRRRVKGRTPNHRQTIVLSASFILATYRGGRELSSLRHSLRMLCSQPVPLSKMTFLR
jgi:hypothetical protein